MDFNSYQADALTTAVYPEKYEVVYPALGLAGEAGEVCEKIKKVLRDNAGVFTPEKVEELKKELGDVLWYLANLASDLDIPLEVVAVDNLEKLRDRQRRGKLRGSGDSR